MTPQELDAQSPVKINRWIEVKSQECKEVDDGLHWFTLKCITIGFEDGYMIADSLGRIWAKFKNDGPYYPFHTEFGKELIGYKLSSKASN